MIISVLQKNLTILNSQTSYLFFHVMISESNYIFGVFSDNFKLIQMSDNFFARIRLDNTITLNCIGLQCPELRVHPAPGVHISTAGCTILGGVHPVYARFLSHLLLLYIGRVHGAISGCTVLWEVHPANAQNKSLVSDTGLLLLSVFDSIQLSPIIRPTLQAFQTLFLGRL